MPGVSSEISNAAIESVNRNRMLEFGKTTCKRIHPEPVIERERSHAGLLVGTWCYIIPDPSGALVSEVVDRKDLALERTHIPGHHFTPTGPTDEHNNEFNRATDDNVFLARSSDEVYPKCESGCAYHGITDFVTNTLMKVQHVAVSENSVHNYCVPRTVIWTWRFVLSRQT